jgi:hypothetical protein
MSFSHHAILKNESHSLSNSYAETNYTWNFVHEINLFLAAVKPASLRAGVLIGDAFVFNTV